jgi:hypothetical protein
MKFAALSCDSPPASSSIAVVSALAGARSFP